MSAPLVKRKGFEAVLDAGRPDHWELAVAAMDGSYECALPWPDSKGATLEELLTSAGVLPGTYRIEAVRVDDGQTDETMKKARSRMRKHGPLSTVYDHGPANNMPPTPTNGATQKAAAISGGPDPEIAELHRQRQRDLAEAAALTARRNLERAQREVESPRDGSDVAALRYELLREMDRIRAEQQKPAPSNSLPLLTALAPLAQALVTTMMQGAQRRDEMLMQLVGAGSSAGAETGGTGVDVMAGVLPLIRQVVELGQELGGGDGGGEDRGMLGDVASIASLLAQIRDGTAPASPNLPTAAADQTPTNPQPRRLPTAEEAVKLRVLQWLATVQEYLVGDADPYSAADQLVTPLGLLPGKFRELVTTGNDVETVLSGLANWMPGPLHERLRSHVRSSDAALAWLEQFLEGLLPEDYGDAEQIAAPAVSDGTTEQQPEPAGP